MICLLYGLCISNVSVSTGVNALEKSTSPQGVSGEGLKYPITLTVNSLDLDEFCAELGKQAGIKLEASREISDHKITARLRKRPLDEVIQALEDLYGFKPRFYERSERYVLYAGDYQKRIAEKKEEGLKDFRNRFDLVRKGLAQHPEIDDPKSVYQRL
ncbi:MAG: hypothetical protein KY468_18550, partial [Armatimonadetes bacterium]|nr:hypothetical protein [Armatimonadota bacterium]